ncbi:carboxymuconolactone decarboxylase family protein [Halofilum ochraceum]|uniref:carboxymuconolactone decarboxylase family protein n=1 Tax=Halofilum ochraceum TaxID=1611323 RepID=UPI00083591DC|nr:hypothetical protein [Halofilum ochraceum]
MSYLPSAPDTTLVDRFRHLPTLAAPLHEFAQQLMRGPSPFSALQRERIAAYVSDQNGCAFCRDSHNEVIVHLGGAPEPRPDSVDDDPLTPVLTFVSALNREPENIGQADVDSVLAAGWDEDALEHAVLVCGFFNLMNRWVDGLGIPSDPETVKMGGRMLYMKGYQAVIDMCTDRGDRQSQAGQVP